eukprot:CAMPEP_0202507430 /NCGR_PEP_ID=MMETSP1361-20130828/51719_1 /ASSEMBLY_ACC=CAM_ASM_000849 /TAXON_ID=210615 /ORGANISM="Staurosira complex sp., Strain CCMP2646" /LENGTH=1296 /DNA_ID=CAMNT_0049141551 /DNA_START=26 /DNA_END=3916 /DNA_ORIENTATION=+
MAETDDGGGTKRIALDAFTITVSPTPNDLDLSEARKVKEIAEELVKAYFESYDWGPSTLYYYMNFTDVDSVLSYQIAAPYSIIRVKGGIVSFDGISTVIPTDAEIQNMIKEQLDPSDGKGAGLTVALQATADFSYVQETIYDVLLGPTSYTVVMPTSAPPTEPPTLVPTPTPPTEPPTLVPTSTPPTRATTLSPTLEPTKRPTPKPTPEPTSPPMKPPTAEPTLSLTDNPTAPPTAVPTKVIMSTPAPSTPTLVPTSTPPTREPTSFQTPVPTNRPTPAPTPGPTTTPPTSRPPSMAPPTSRPPSTAQSVPSASPPTSRPPTAEQPVTATEPETTPAPVSQPSSAAPISQPTSAKPVTLPPTTTSPTVSPTSAPSASSIPPTTAVPVATSEPTAAPSTEPDLVPTTAPSIASTPSKTDVSVATPEPTMMPLSGFARTPMPSTVGVSQTSEPQVAPLVPTAAPSPGLVQSQTIDTHTSKAATFPVIAGSAAGLLLLASLAVLLVYKRRRQKAAWRKNVSHLHDVQEGDLEQAIKDSDAVMSEAGSSRLGRLLLSTAGTVHGGSHATMNPSEATPSQSSSDDDFSAFDGCTTSVEPIIVPIDTDDYMESVEVEEGRCGLESGTAVLVTSHAVSDEPKVAKEVPPSTDTDVDEGLLFIESIAANFYDGVCAEYVAPIRPLEMKAQDKLNGNSVLAVESAALPPMVALWADTEQDGDTTVSNKGEVLVELEKGAAEPLNENVEHGSEFDIEMPSVKKNQQLDAKNEIHVHPATSRNSNSHNSYTEWHLKSDVNGLDVRRQAYAAENDFDLMAFADASVADSDVSEDIDLMMQTNVEEERGLSASVYRDPSTKDGIDASDTLSDVFDDLQTYTGQEKTPSSAVDRYPNAKDGVDASDTHTDVFDDVQNYTGQKETPGSTVDRDPDAKDGVDASDTLTDVFDEIQTYTEQEETPSSTVDRDPTNQDDVDSIDTLSDVFDDVQTYTEQEETPSSTVDRDPTNQDGVDARDTISDVFSDVEAGTVVDRNPNIEHDDDASDAISDVFEKLDAEMQNFTEHEEDAISVIKRDSINEQNDDASVAKLDVDTTHEVDESVVVEEDPNSDDCCAVDMDMQANVAPPWPEVNEEPFAVTQPHELAFLQASPGYATLTSSPPMRWGDVSSEDSLVHSMSVNEDHQDFSLDESWDFNDNVDDSIDIVDDPFQTASTLPSNDTRPLLGNGSEGSCKEQTSSDETVNSDGSSRGLLDSEIDESLHDPFQTPSTTPVSDEKPLLGQVLGTYKLNKVTANEEKQRRSKSAPPRTKC